VLSIVLPCYNEAPSLPVLLGGYARACPAELAAEVVVVDNGSTDDTAAVLERLVRADTDGARLLRPVKVPVNRGYGHGIATGLRAAGGEFLAWSHADEQCDPADVFAAFARLRAARDPRRTLIKGRRQRRPLRESATTIGMQLFARVLLGTRVTDINAQPKVFHRDLLARLPAPPDDFSFDLYVLYQAERAGWTLETVPVVFRRRAHGVSRWAATWRSRRRHVAATLRYMRALRARGRA
jgi:glycosyltransferase involved in cell wall biosynthesis